MVAVRLTALSLNGLGTLTVRDTPLNEPLELSNRESLHGYQLHVVQEVLLALLAQSTAHGYELRARLALAPGPLADALSEGQVYVILGRLEKSGLVRSLRLGQVWCCGCRRI